MDATTAALIQRDAERLAANGDSGAALTALDRLGEDAGVAGAVLRARILAQRGDFAHAADSWRAALSADPENDNARRGLALTEALARSPIGRLRLQGRAWLVLLLAVVLLASAWLTTRSAGGAPTNQHLADSLERMERQRADDLRATSEQIDRQLRELRQAIEASHSEIRTLLADQKLASAQTRDQLRRLERRSMDVAEAVRRLASAPGTASGPRGGR